MKYIIITILFGLCVAFGYSLACHYKKTVIADEQIRTIRETQQQLIDAGYERVYVPRRGEWCTLAADGKWGEITDAAYCQYKCDEALEVMGSK